MARQTVEFDQWIVADGGFNPQPVTMGQMVVRNPGPPGITNFIHNVLATIDLVQAEVVVVVENDDFYRPNHIETCVRRLADHDATGCTWLNYYNVELRAWRRIRNSCAALCNTAFRANRLPDLKAAAEDAMRHGIYHVDRLFWRRVGPAGLHQEETVIGIKGLPGRRGIGIGHKREGAWTPDPHGVKAREWLGTDAARYAEVCGWA